MSTRALTLAFSDVVGSTALSVAAADPDALRRRYTTVLRAAVHRHGGREVKHLGDGLMAAFPSAGAAIDASVDVHRCTGALARRTGMDLAVRVGLAHGDVSEEDGDIFGEAVIVAARLCGAAGAGQTLATELVPAVAGRTADRSIEPVGALDLKGLPEAVPVVRIDPDRVVAPGPTEGVPAPLCQQLARDLVGRHAVVDALQEAVLGAVGGRGSALLLEGDGGLGKTRLAAEAAAMVVELGGVVAYGAVDAGLADLYAALAVITAELAARDQAVAAAVDHAGRPLSPMLPDAPVDGIAADRRATFDAIAETIAAVSAAPAVVVVDDLHHAGQEAASLFAHVASRLSEAPVLLLGLTRPGAADPGATAGTPTLRLSALTAGDVAELARRRGLGANLAGPVLALTSGHPLLVDEVLKSLAGREATLRAGTHELLGVPSSIEGLVRRQLDDLGGTARDVALVMAVAGPDSDRELLQWVLGDDPAIDAGVAALVGAELVVDLGLGQHRFRHELFRRAVLDVAGTAVTARTHRLVADALAAQGAPTRTQAWHRIAAADDTDLDDVADHVLEVIGEERRRLAMPVAERLAGALLDRLTDLRADRPAAAARAHVELARVASWTADADAARRHATAAVEHARRCGDADALVEGVIQHTGWVDAGTQDPTAEALFREAHEILDLATLPRQARLLAAEADYWSISRSKPAHGRPLAEAARQLADRSGDPLALVDSLWSLANATLGDAALQERLDIVRRLLAASGAEPSAHVLAHRLGVHTHLEAGDLANRDRSAAMLHELADRDGEGSARLWAAVADVEALLRTGDLDEAESAIAHLASGGDDPTRRNIVVAQLFKLSRERGDLGALLPMLDSAVAEAPELPGFVAARLLALQGAGRFGDAAAGLADLLRDGADAVPLDQSRGAVLVGLAELAADVGAVAEAEMLLDALSDRSGSICVAAQGVFSLGSYDRAIGRLHAVLGRPGDARRYLEAALSLEGAVGDQPSRERTMAALASLPGRPSQMISVHGSHAPTGARP